MNIHSFRSLVSAAVVAAVGLTSFTASAAITVTTGSLSGGANQLDTTDDLILGKLPLGVTNDKKGQEGCNSTGSVLTDGIAKNNSPYSEGVYSIGNATVLVYSLGDNAAGYDVTNVTAHFGWGDGGRASSTLSKIRYAVASDPDTFIDTGITPRAGASGVNNYVSFSFSGADEPKGACKIEVTVVAGHSYSGMLELLVRGTAAEVLPFLEINDLPVVNAKSGSQKFVNGTELAFVSAPSVFNAKTWTRQDVFDLASVGSATWSAMADFPSAFSFGRPSSDADISVWYWFDSDAANYTRRVGRTAPMRYTLVRPVVSTVASVERFVHGNAIRLWAFECDTGTTGGVSSGDGIESLDIPVLTNLLEIVSGPCADLDPDPSVVSVDQTGSYTLRFISYNAAGNCATNDFPYTVGSIPTGITFTWTGAVSTDWYTPGNWDRGCFPIPTDDIVIPAGCAKYPALDPIDLPREGGAYGSLSVAAGAKISFKGDESFVNAASGGADAKPHGRGPVLTCASATIDGTLTADDLGFSKGKGPMGGADGAGYANAFLINSQGGVTYQTASHTRRPYGSVTEPTALGSGSELSPGGGAIKLVCTGDLVLNGTITASSSKRGAGGSIWLACDTFSGTGAVRAESKYSDGRSGSGGRIAIYRNSTTFSGTISALGEFLSNASSCGGAGTLYEPGRYPLGTAESPADVTFGGGFNYVFENEEPHYWNLTVTPGCRGGFKAGNLHLGDFALSGAYTYIEFGAMTLGMERDMQVLEFDSITLSDTAILRLPGGYSGARKFKMKTLTVGPSARLNTGLNDWSFADAAHGGTAAAPLGRGVEIFCESATIAGTLSVSYQGFGLGYGPNPGSDNGSGHGGVAGATGNVGQRGYGSFCSPTTLGCCWNDGGALGGGAVRLSVSGELALTGKIDSDASGRGSGGSIWLQAGRLTGNGKLQANSPDARRPGAGGRIAIEAANNEFTGTVAASVGAAYNDNKSYPGTYFKRTAPSWAAIEGDVGAARMETAYSKNVFNSTVGAWNVSDLYCAEQAVTSWKPGPARYEWTEKAFTRISGTAVANAATYTFRKMRPNFYYKAAVNGTVVKGENKDLVSDSNGVLTFSVDLPQANNTLSLNYLFPPGLAVIMR